MEGWPEKFHVTPTLREVGQFLGRLVSLPEGGYPSEYPKHPERRQKQETVDHYEAMAAEAAADPDLNGYGEIADSLRG